MSYRLIDANLIAESHPEVSDMPCIYVDLPRGLDGGHYDMRGIDELQAENAKLFTLLKHESEQTEKLRELVQRADRLLTDLFPHIDYSRCTALEAVAAWRVRARGLKAENAKLRELASILCFCMQIHKRCADCKLDGTKGELGHDPLLACRELHAMLRELGVEDK